MRSMEVLWNDSYFYLKMAWGLLTHSSFLSLHSYQWPNGKIPLSHWQKMIVAYNIRVPFDSTVIPLNFENILYLAKYHYTEYPSLYLSHDEKILKLLDKNKKFQTMRSISPQEEKLLQHMEHKKYPPEVAQIIIHTECHRVFSSSYLKGGLCHGPHSSELKKHINDLFRQVENQSLVPQYITIQHTHPHHELLWRDQEGNVKILFHPLSESDIELEQKLSQLLSLPVAIQAISLGKILYHL